MSEPTNTTAPEPGPHQTALKNIMKAMEHEARAIQADLQRERFKRMELEEQLDLVEKNIDRLSGALAGTQQLHAKFEEITVKALTASPPSKPAADANPTADGEKPSEQSGQK